LYKSGDRKMRFNVFVPPPLQPQTATRSMSA
jgi:hypothetical protein